MTESAIVTLQTSGGIVGDRNTRFWLMQPKVCIDGRMVCLPGGKVLSCEPSFLSMQQKVRIDGQMVWLDGSFFHSSEQKVLADGGTFYGIGGKESACDRFFQTAKPFFRGVKLFLQGVKPFLQGVKPFLQGVELKRCRR